MSGFCFVIIFIDSDTGNSLLTSLKIFSYLQWSNEPMPVRRSIQCKFTDCE